MPVANPEQAKQIIAEFNAELKNSGLTVEEFNAERNKLSDERFAKVRRNPAVTQLWNEVENETEE
jgi:hypothetical protein